MPVNLLTFKKLVREAVVSKEIIRVDKKTKRLTQLTG
jgi:hypothetical protein